MYCLFYNALFLQSGTHVHVECAFLQVLTCGGGAGENGGGGGRPGGLEGRDMVDVRDSETSTKVDRFCGC